MSYNYGNDYGTKLKDPDIRQEAYRQYCDHLASGNPKEAFFFDHPTHSVCHKTMERYIKESPEEFPSHLLEKAKAARFLYWFNEGKSIMKGSYKYGSPAVWQTIMRNIFKKQGWDQREYIEQDALSSVAQNQQAILNQIGALQHLAQSSIDITPDD